MPHIGRKRKLGRPNKLTPKRVKAILAAVRDGATLLSCAGAGGISSSTLTRWLARGERDIGNEQHDTDYARFRAAFDEAMQEADRALETSIYHAATKPRIRDRKTRRRYDDDGNLVEEIEQVRQEPADWRAAAKILAMRHPQYRTTRRHEHSGPEGGAIPVAVVNAIEQLSEQQLDVLDDNLQLIEQQLDDEED